MGRHNRFHEGVRFHHPQLNLERTQILQHRIWLHPLRKETVQRPESHSIGRRRKWHVRDKERNKTWWSTVKLALQHRFADSMWKKRHSAPAKGMGIYLRHNDHDCLTNMRLLTTCSCMHLQKNSSKNGIWIQAKHRKGGTQDSSSKDENSQQPKFVHQKRNWDLWHGRRNINKRGKYKILGSDNNVLAGEEDRNHKSNQSRLGDVPQVLTRIDIENVHAQTPASGFRRIDDTHDELSFWNLNTHETSRKNDSIDATPDVSPHHTNEKKTQKDLQTKRWDQRERRWKWRSEFRHAQRSRHQHLFVKKIEEEDWIDYIKRSSTEEAINKMNEMENDIENLISNKWEMDGERCLTELWTHFKIQDIMRNWLTQKKMGRRHQRIFKFEENKTENSTESETTNHGSKQQKPVEDGFYLENISHWLEKKDLNQCET